MSEHRYWWRERAERLGPPVVWQEEDGSWTHHIEPHRTYCNVRHRTKTAAVGCWAEWVSQAGDRMERLQAMAQEARERHYTCEECGELIEGADYYHRPTCSAFPPSPTPEMMALVIRHARERSY